MLRSIDRAFRRACGPLLVGMPLFFITVSPYGNKEKKEKDEKRSFSEVAMDSQSLVQKALAGDDVDAVDPEVSLYNLYLAKASVATPTISTEPHKEFMSIAPSAAPSSRGDVSYSDLIDAYLGKVEYMIEVDKDYFSALMELDKVMVVAPTNQKALYLRTKLKNKLKDELERVKRKHGTEIDTGDSEIVTIKEKALLEAEKKLLKQGIDETPYKARVETQSDKTVSDDAVNTEKHDAIALKALPVTPAKPHTQPRPEAATKPRVHRDVVIIKSEDLLSIRAERKDMTTEREVAVESPLPNKSPEAPIAEEGVKVKALKTEEIRTKEAPAEKVIVVTPQKADKIFTKDDTAVEEEPHRQKAQRAEFFEERAKEYMLRGKNYYRDKKFALALISFGKAKQYDAMTGRFSVEIEKLIGMTREQLEAIANKV